MIDIPPCFDKAEYYYDEALDANEEEFSDREGGFSEEQNARIYRLAGMHIGFYLTWIIRKGHLGDMHKEEAADLAAAEKVKGGEMDGIDYFMEYCDGKLYPEDMTDEMAEYTANFYPRYFRIYCDFVINEICDLPFEFIGSWEDYLEFEPILDSYYKKWKR